MIVSHRHRYVFVEVPHTGSTAISNELLENYDGESILRKHATYRDFLRTATPDRRDYFAFAAVRNPLDLAVSRYFLMKKKARNVLGDDKWVAKHGSVAQKVDLRIERWIERNEATFDQFLMRWYRIPFDSWTSLDQSRYKAVLRFESLVEDFDRTIRQVGIEPVRPLPSANATPGRARDFASYYTTPAQRRARWVFGPFMRQWGYEFPPQWGPINVPGWAMVYMRAARGVRSLYWRFLRFRNPRRPGQLSPSPFE